MQYLIKFREIVPGFTFQLLVKHNLQVYQGYISKAFSSGDKTSAQLTLQRSLLLAGVTFLVAQTPLIIDSGLFLRLLYQKREVSNAASDMALIVLPGYLAGFIYEIFYRTLFSRKHVWPAIVSGAVSGACALLVQLLSFYVLGWGLVGIALADCFALIGGAIAIMVIFQKHEFVQEMSLLVPSRDALVQWKEMGVSYAASVVLQIAQRFIYEFPLILGGIISTEELATANVVRRYSLLFALFGMGYTTPCIASIGTAIGARSRTSLYVYTAAIFSAFGVFLTIATAANILLRYPLASMTVEDANIVEMSAHLTILVAFYDLVKVLISYAIYSIFRGNGSIIFPTVISLTTEYLLGMPLGLYLSLFRGWGISGYYWAMIASYFIEIALNLFYLWIFLWPQMLKEIDKPKVEVLPVPNNEPGQSSIQMQPSQMIINGQTEEDIPILAGQQKTSLGFAVGLKFVIIIFISFAFVIIATCAKVILY